MKGFSFIVSTHNPEPSLFREVINNLILIAKKSTSPCELIIVDNNSFIPLDQNKELVQQINDVKWIRLIREEKAGLTFARIAGYQHSMYEWMIFVDDDNLPNQEFIKELEHLTEKFPEVKCWGAGKIEVKYIGQVETIFLKSIKSTFQERNFSGVNFSCNRKGEEYYPPGSCMCVEKIVFEKYYNLIKKGFVTSTDRTGNSLNSAGDTQIIYCCILNNFLVGSSSNLSLKHLINKKKTRISYLLRLKYALSSCHIKAYNEVFFDNPIIVKPTTTKSILKSLYSRLRINGLFPTKKTLMDLSAVMGEHNSHHLAGGYAKPFLLRIFEMLIGHK